MITDPRVFENEYLPREFMHREAEVEELTRAFHPAVSGQGADHALISGPSGVGKTVLARYALKQLREVAHVDRAHIRSLGMTTGDLLRNALREHCSAVDISQNKPVEQLRNQLRDVIEDPYILVLDEADDLPNTDAIDQLIGIPKISIVAICHEPESWLARAPQDVRRNLRQHIQLERYGVDELADILQTRVNEGLPPNVIRREQLQTIANEVIGVARFGIQSLRAAAEIAQERGHSRIRDRDIADSFDRARYRIRRSNLNSLPFHHHLVYVLIHEIDRMAASDLYERYEELTEEFYFGRDLTPHRSAMLPKITSDFIRFESLGW